VYYLAIKNLPTLLDIFPHFVPFAILATIIGAPLAVIIGWLHVKRTSAYTSEMDIGVEANPYNYKIVPGKEKELWTPFNILLLKLLEQLLDAQNLLSKEGKDQIRELQRRMQALIDGELAGTPRRSI
jgi:hypothetical protein